MASITYRALDQNGDPIFGQGQTTFLTDIDAVAQAIRTKLLLFQGEWFENLLEGTPMFQSILGVGGAARRSSAIALLLKTRILQVPFVNDVINISISFNAGNRSLSFSCVAQTQFGNISISNLPGSSAIL